MVSNAGLGWIMMNRAVLLLIISISSAFNNVQLPNVLIIGDSISIGSTPFAQESLKGKAKVVHYEGKAKHTFHGLEKLDEWLSDTEWDVIHFNWGLWDLAYVADTSEHGGNRDKTNGTVTTTLEQYEQNLNQLVDKLHYTGANFFFATTTFVPDGEPSRKYKDNINYNQVARRVMKERCIIINDRGKLSRKVHKKYKER